MTTADVLKAIEWQRARPGEPIYLTTRIEVTP